MIKARLGTDLDRVIHRVFPFVAKVGLRPDTLTLLGVATSALAAVAFGLHYPVLAGLVLIAAGFFDLIDGVVARSQGSSGLAGAFLDSSMDRLADLLIFTGIAYGMATRGDALGVLLVCWAMIGSVMTSYSRARAEQHLESLSVGWMERAERVVVLILGALTGFLELALWVVALGSTATSLQRVWTARRLLQQLDPNGGSGAQAEATQGES